MGRWVGLLVIEVSGDGGDARVVTRKAFACFGCDDLALKPNRELAALPIHAGRTNPEGVCDCIRYPSGSRSIVSDPAVVNFHFDHEDSHGSGSMVHAGKGSGSGIGQVSPQ